MLSDRLYVTGDNRIEDRSMLLGRGNESLGVQAEARIEHVCANPDYVLKLKQARVTGAFKNADMEGHVCWQESLDVQRIGSVCHPPHMAPQLIDSSLGLWSRSSQPRRKHID